jgi:hypothetical protein
MPATAQSTSLWYEVQGLALCPAADHDSAICRVPDKGEWHTLYHMSTEKEGLEALAWVLDQDDPWLDHFEDFRLASPDAERLRKKAKADKARAEMRPMRRVA